MYYQVVARPSIQPGKWDFYPHWAPTRDKDGATRLAKFAGQNGHEAAILQSLTIPILRSVAYGVIERQDARLLPPVRYALGVRVSTSAERGRFDWERVIEPIEEFDPYRGSPAKAALDAARLDLELGVGGDVTRFPGAQAERISFTAQWDVLQIWLSLRRKLLAGEVGEATDGAPFESRDK